MKIAGVGVSEKSPLTKERLIEMALTTKAYYQLPKEKALFLIEKEIEASGLYKSDKKQSEKPNKSNTRSSGRGNARKRKVDKENDKK